jgi:Domain of unknown function (DUF4760)
LNTFGTFGTFVVIAATAVAALVQLRHMRGSNQISVMSDLFEKRNAPEFVSAAYFAATRLPEKMRDPAFRYQVAHRPARTEENAALIAKVIAVGNYYEEMGLLAKSGLVDRELMLDMHSGSVVAMWNALNEMMAIMREARGPAIYENFEYITVLAQDWGAKHPSGTYPANVRRIDLPNKWREADLAYAASLAT